MRCQYCGMLPCICDDTTITEACPDCGEERNACTCDAHACWACGRAPAGCVCGSADPAPSLPAALFVARGRALFGEER